jgi:hypothetical protein
MGVAPRRNCNRQRRHSRLFKSKTHSQVIVRFILIGIAQSELQVACLIPGKKAISRQGAGKRRNSEQDASAASDDTGARSNLPAAAL